MANNESMPNVGLYAKEEENRQGKAACDGDEHPPCFAQHEEWGKGCPSTAPKFLLYQILP